MATDQTGREQLQVTDEEYAILEAEAAKTEGLSVEQVEGEDIVDGLIIIAIFGGASLVAGTVSYILERRKGGYVIDLRKDAPKREYRSKDVEYGLVYVYAADGTVTIEVKKGKSFYVEVIEAVLEALKGVVTDSVKAAADAVKDATGSDTDVKTDDDPDKELPPER